MEATTQRKTAPKHHPPLLSLSPLSDEPLPCLSWLDDRGGQSRCRCPPPFQPHPLFLMQITSPRVQGGTSVPTPFAEFITKERRWGGQYTCRGRKRYSLHSAPAQHLVHRPLSSSPLLLRLLFPHCCIPWRLGAQSYTSRTSHSPKGCPAVPRDDDGCICRPILLLMVMCCLPKIS